MGTFADQESADMAVFFNEEEYGHAATYIPPGTDEDDGTDIVVRLDEISESPSEWSGGLSLARRVVIQRSEVSNPVRQAVIKIGSDYWQIQRTISQDDSVTVLECAASFKPRR